MGFFGKEQKQEKQISKVKVLGIRTGEETRVLATVNSSIYCLLVLYADGTRDLIECEYKNMQKYLNFINID